MRLITDYLDFAKIDAGYLRLDREPTDLVEVARRAAAAAELQAGVKSIELRRRSARVCGHGAGDGSKLEQTLENLLSNAIKYTADGGTVTLSLRVDDGRGAIHGD